MESNPGLPAKHSRSRKFPDKTEESITEARIVTASVTVLRVRPGLFFPFNEYDLEGEAARKPLHLSFDLLHRIDPARH